MLIGEDRKKPSKTLLLNTKILYDTTVENKLDIIRQMLQWAYDLYNDILRDTEVRGLQQEVKEYKQENLTKLFFKFYFSKRFIFKNCINKFFNFLL